MIPAGSLVCVTGAGGFLASWLVKALLERGLRVRGTVRDLGRADHLRALPRAPELLELVEADLLRERDFDPAIAGCDVVFHTASPYKVAVGDPQRDLVEPAVLGTQHVMAACVRTPSVRRVVMTSSATAVTDEPPDRVLTEEDWNTTSTLTRNPYHLSKTLAERAAWELVERVRPAFDLVVVNPVLVFGPSLTPALNETNNILVDLLRGVYPAIVRLHFGIVDVRDVAEAHLRAGYAPAASGRYLCAAGVASMREIVGWLKEAGYGPGTRLPSLPLDSRLGDWLVWLDSWRRAPGVGSYLRSHVGRVPRFDTGKIRRDLEMPFRPVRTTLLEAMQDLERWEHVKRRPARIPS